jgi:hypothetical protein
MNNTKVCPVIRTLHEPPFLLDGIPPVVRGALANTCRYPRVFLHGLEGESITHYLLLRSHPCSNSHLWAFKQNSTRTQALVGTPDVIRRRLAEIEQAGAQEITCEGFGANQAVRTGTPAKIAGFSWQRVDSILSTLKTCRQPAARSSDVRSESSPPRR